MDIQERRRGALVFAAIAGVLAGTLPWTYDDGFGTILVVAHGGVVWTLMLLVAVGGVAYAAGSWAAEQVMSERRRIDRASGSGRRADREVPPTIVLGHVRDGVATPAELADVLGVHLHVARQMLETLVAEGRLLERDGRVTAPEPRSRTLPAGPRWIDPED